AAVSAGRTRLSIVRASMRNTVSRGRVEIPPTHPPESQCGRDGRESDAVGAGGGIGGVGTSDAALVRRVQTGDTRAYADLVARYRDRLGRYALHMLGNREDAEEVLQDAFVRAYRSLARCDDPERFGAWLYGILVNRCRTTGGRAARRARLFVRNDGAPSGGAPPRSAARAAWAHPARRAAGGRARPTTSGGSPGRASWRSRRSAGWRSQRRWPRSRWCYRAGAPGQRRPRRTRHASLSSSSSPPARQACRSWATSTTGTPPAPRCDLHNAAAR